MLKKFRPLQELASSKGVSDDGDVGEMSVTVLASIIIATTSLIVGLFSGDGLVQNNAILKKRDISCVVFLQLKSNLLSNISETGIIPLIDLLTHVTRSPP